MLWQFGIEIKSLFFLLILFVCCVSSITLCSALHTLPLNVIMATICHWIYDVLISYIRDVHIQYQYVENGEAG